MNTLICVFQVPGTAALSRDLGSERDGSAQAQSPSPAPAHESLRQGLAPPPVAEPTRGREAGPASPGGQRKSLRCSSRGRGRFLDELLLDWPTFHGGVTVAEAGPEAAEPAGLSALREVGGG